jgi:uncharacterized membrane protein AbrB (regulator of aidB expression)
MMVVVIIPFSLTCFNGRGSDIYTRVLAPANAVGLIQLLAVGLRGGALLAWLGLPNALMLGPLAVTIALTVR